MARRNLRRTIVYTALCLAAILGTTGALTAEPIGFVTVDSRQNAELAQTIAGPAYLRIGNRFLVTADEARQKELSAAGMTFETVIEDGHPDFVFQILDMARERLPETIDLEQLGTVVDLGHGVRIMPMSRAEAASLSDNSRLKAVPLSARSIDIFYPRTVVNAALADEYPSDSLIARINPDSLRSYVQRMENFRTRYTYTDSCAAARAWLVQKFQSWGYTDVTAPQFYFNGWRYNVKAVKPGTAEPDKIIVIGGHYDSYTNSQQSPGTWEYAPGADDDASGVALTLEIARVLANVPLRKTVVFMPFDAEEVGLVGSEDAAADFRAANAKLEVMYNFDMVAYTDNSVWNLDYSSGDITAFREFSTATALRVSDIIPLTTYMGTSSDHYSFEQQGFAIVDHIETDFNTPGWHTNLDLTSRLNFPYFYEVTKAALASLAVVADAAYPVAVDEVLDPGDGQTLNIAWTDCNSACTYRVYWGPSAGSYTDSAVVPTGACEYTIGGLSDGATYHVLVIGEAPTGYRAFYGIEGQGTPLLYPRAPQGLAGTPASSQMRLNLSWQANGELDFSHYRVYRRYGTVGEWQLLADGLTGTSYADTDVLPHVGYEYAITAVDDTGYESGLSSTVLLYPATYDGGPVVADGFVMDHEYDPDQAEQEAWLDTILGAIGFGVASSDEHGSPVTLGSIGQYGTLLWIDDDVITKNIAASSSALDEYSKHGTNMLISGYRTWYDWSAKTVPTSHLLYREFGLVNYDNTPYFDFVGAVGVNGWPSVQIDRTRGMREWRDISKMTGRSGSQVILTFDSELDLPDWEGKPAGIVYSTANGKRVLLGFPLYYLTPSSATALMAKVFEYFAVVDEYEQGDLDHSGTIDIRDIAILIDHLFINMEPLLYPEEADMDGRPGVSIGDVFYLIDYLFMGGPSPVPEM